MLPQGRKKSYNKPTNFPLFHSFEIQTGNVVELSPPPLEGTQQGAIHLCESFSPAPGLCLEHNARVPSSVLKKNWFVSLAKAIQQDKKKAW